MTRPPEKAGAPRETKPREPPQRPDPSRGRTDIGRGEGTKTHPPARPTQEQPTDGGDRAAPRGAAAMGNAEAAARTETGDGGVGHLEAHPTGAASAAAAGGPVSGDRASRGGRKNGAGQFPAYPTGVVLAAPEGGPVRARPAPSSGTGPRLEGGDETPRSESEEESTADEAMAERAPPERPRSLTASG